MGRCMNVTFWTVNSSWPWRTLADLPIVNSQNQTRCNHFLQPSACLSIQGRESKRVGGGPVEWPPADPARIPSEPADDKPDVLSVSFFLPLRLSQAQLVLAGRGGFVW